MTPDKPRPLLQLSLIAFVLSFCLGCNALVQTAQHLENKDLPSSLAVQDGTLQMEARLLFGPTYTAADKTGSDLQGEIILKGPSAVLQKLDLYRLSLRPARTGYYYQHFQEGQDGKWEHVHGERRGGPIEVDISTESEQMTLRFRWRNRANEKSIAWYRESGLDVILSFYLDGKYMAVGQHALPIAPPSQ